MPLHIEDSSPRAADAVQPYFFRLNLILFCASCAWIVWRTAWLLGSIPYDTSHARDAVLHVLIPASGPFLAAGLSLLALKRRSPQGALASAFIGVFIAICLLISMLFTLGGMLYPGKSYLPFLIGAVLLISRTVVGFLNVITTDKRPAWKRERKSHLWIIVSVVGTLVALQLWSALSIPIVAWRAAAVAGSDPYCFQVPAYGHRAAPVANWGQLAGLRNRTLHVLVGEALNDHPEDEWQVSFHSILVVERGAKSDFYTWSHFDQNFVAVPERTIQAFAIERACEPKPGFLETLNVF